MLKERDITIKGIILPKIIYMIMKMNLIIIIFIIILIIIELINMKIQKLKLIQDFILLNTVLRRKIFFQIKMKILILKYPNI